MAKLFRRSCGQVVSCIGFNSFPCQTLEAHACHNAGKELQYWYTIVGKSQSIQHQSRRICCRSKDEAFLKPNKEGISSYYSAGLLLMLATLWSLDSSHTDVMIPYLYEGQGRLGAKENVKMFSNVNHKKMENPLLWSNMLSAFISKYDLKRSVLFWMISY